MSIRISTLVILLILVLAVVSLLGFAVSGDLAPLVGIAVCLPVLGIGFPALLGLVIYRIAEWWSTRQTSHGPKSTTDNRPSPVAKSQQPPNWPQQPGQQNPFSDQGQSPFGPGGPYPGQFGPPPRPLEDEPAMRWILPVGQSLWSIAAGYLGLFSLLCFPAPLALIVSLIAIWHLRRNPRLSGWGRAIFGLLMGIVGTIGFVFMLIGIAAGQ